MIKYGESNKVFPSKVSATFQLIVLLEKQIISDWLEKKPMFQSWNNMYIFYTLKNHKKKCTYLLDAKYVSSTN